MRIINTKEIVQKLYAMALEACTSITPDCYQALSSAYNKEQGSTKFALQTLIENADIAQQNAMPVCQDTGLAVIVLEIGQDVFLEGDSLNTSINRAIKKAYLDGYFRKSVCDPITRQNTGDNTPASIHTHIVDGDKITITFLPKGFGSENMSKLYMLKPSQGVEGIIDAIVDTVKSAGSRPCPPVVVGVGIGGTFDSCAYAAKRALFREIDSSSQREDILYIEKTALERINALNIGCQGFHGNITALAVLCEWLPTHIAGLPVAVNIQCHCVRRRKEIL